MSLPVDHLYVACTRPFMKMGVTYGGWRANAILTTGLTVCLVQNPLGFLAGVLVHFVLRELCRADPHFFRRWSLYSKTKGRAGTRFIWGGSRLDPTPARFLNATEVPSCV